MNGLNSQALDTEDNQLHYKPLSNRTQNRGQNETGPKRETGTLSEYCLQESFKIFVVTFSEKKSEFWQKNRHFG